MGEVTNIIVYLTPEPTVIPTATPSPTLIPEISPLVTDMLADFNDIHNGLTIAFYPIFQNILFVGLSVFIVIRLFKSI